MGYFNKTKVASNKVAEQPHVTVPTLPERRQLANTVLSTALMWILFLALLLPGLALAQDAPYPQPLLPKPLATSIDVTPVFFSWTRFYVATEEYTFQLAKTADMSSPIVNAKINGDNPTYTYRGTLEYNTTYYWRVMASKPLGDWSPVSIFTTKPSPAASTNNATAPPKDSTKKSFLSDLETIGWPIIGAIAGVVLLIVVVAIVVLMKPKTPPTGSRQWQGGPPPPYMQQPRICPACGFSNSPERGFCSNCGTNLSTRGPQQTWGPPPMQQQTNTCPACGFPNNPPDRKFCGSCGASLTTAWQQPPQVPPQQNYQVYQSYSCPICGAPINKGTNPCPNCRTWLDWGPY